MNAGFSSPFHAKLRQHSFQIEISNGRAKYNLLAEANDLLKGIFRTKNLNDILSALGDETHQLKRSLGPLSITLLGIGAIIGAGIFADAVAASEKRKPVATAEPGKSALYNELYEEWKEILKSKLHITDEVNT